MANECRDVIAPKHNLHATFSYRNLLATLVKTPLKCTSLANLLLSISEGHASLAPYRSRVFQLLEVEARVNKKDGCRKSVYQYWRKRYEDNDKVLTNQVLKLLSLTSRKPSFIYIADSNAAFKDTLSTVRSLRRQYYSKIKVIFDVTRGDKRIKQLRHASGTLEVIIPQGSIAEYISKNDLIMDIVAGDHLSRSALLEIALCAIDNEEWDLAYFDEDTRSRFGHYKAPFLKPDYSPIWFSGFDYISGACVLRARTYLRLIDRGEKNLSVGRFISQNPDVNILHISQILLHRAKTRKRHICNNIVAHNNSKKDYKDAGLVSIIIPTKDNVSYLSRCIDSVLRVSWEKNIQIIIINNRSEKAQTYRYFDTVSSVRQIEVIDYMHEFNYSAINNFAVKYAKGEYLVFLNDDTEVISPDWLERMVWWLRNDRIGCVGAKLLYPDKTIQHIGVATGVGMGASHYDIGNTVNAPGYFDMNVIPRETSAVTAACVGVRKRTYLRIGGFDEKMAISFNDVELCTRLRSLGYENVIDPDILLYHYESKSRGYDNNDNKRIRDLKERNYYIKKTMLDVRYDPYYNRNFSISNAYCLGFPPRALSQTDIEKMSIRHCVVLLGSIKSQREILEDTIVQHVKELNRMGYTTVVGVDDVISIENDGSDVELVFNERDAADMIRRKLAKYVIVYSNSFDKLIWLVPKEVDIFLFESSKYSEKVKFEFTSFERYPIEKYGHKISSLEEFSILTNVLPLAKREI